MSDPDCHFGDHLYLGGGTCVRCHKPLRCYCGRFIREDELDAHIGDEEHPGDCPFVTASLRSQVPA